MLAKQKPNFATGSTIIKVKHRVFRRGNQRVPQKRFHADCCLDDHSGIFGSLNNVKHMSS